MNQILMSVTALLLLVVISDAKATSFRSGENISMDSTLEGDTYIACQSLTLNKPVHGDLVAAAQNIFIKDTVTGDLAVAGESVDVSGFVGDDIRNAAQTFTLEGKTAGDVIVFSGKSFFSRNSIIGGDLVVFSGELNIDGTIEGNLIVHGGKVNLRGTVKGALKVKGGEIFIEGAVTGPSEISGEKITIDNQANFTGDIMYWQEGGELKDTGFSHAGKFTFDPSLQIKDEQKGKAGFGFMFLLWSILSGILLLVILTFLLPSLFSSAGSYVRTHAAGSFGIGILYFFAVPFICLFLMITVVGIPVGVMLMFFYIFTLISGLVITSLVVAYFVRNNFNKSWSRWGVFGISILILFGLHLILVIPFLGFLLTVLLVAASFGALIMSARRRDKGESAMTA